MKKIKGFIGDSLFKQILALSLPSMVGMFFETLYDIINMAWVGRLSINAVAAVTIFATVWWILNVVNDVVGTSSVSMISRCYGSGDTEKTIETIEQTIIFKFLLALISGGVICVLIPYILRPLANNNEVLDMAVAFGRIRLITLPLAFSSYTVNTALRCIGDAKKPLYIMAISSITNIILDPIMIFDKIPFIGIKGMGLGIVGAAYATVFCQSMAFVIGLFILMSGRTFVKISFKRGIYFVKATDLKLLTIGLPTGIEGLLRNIAGFIVMKYIAAYGVAVVAAFGICSRIATLIIMPIFGLEMGAGIIVGQNLGASNIERAERTGYITAKTAFVMMLLAGVFLVLLPKQMMSIFTDNIDIINVGVVYLRFFAVSALFAGPAGGLLSVLFGAGDNMPSMITSLVTIWLIQIPLLYLFVNLLHLTINWVWFTYVLIYAIQFVAIVYFVRRGRWKTKCVLD